MDIVIQPQKLCGEFNIIPSKSQAHRHLICAAFSDNPTVIICQETNRDIEATVNCLNALSAKITRTDDGYLVVPVDTVPQSATLNCGESGSTLRFMLPVVGALGVNATFQMSGRLPERPLSPLWEEMERMGCQLTWVAKDRLSCLGHLKSGKYTIAGDVSSQFISGLLFALALIPGDSQLAITGKIESVPYIELTRNALTAFGVSTSNFQLCGAYPFRSPGIVRIEGDWSNGAFFAVANYLGNKVVAHGLDPLSPQGDRAVLQILENLQELSEIDAADIPDLVPILSIAAAATKGAKFTNVSRLRLKESDRVLSVANMLKAFGISTSVDDNTLTVYPGQFHSCTVDAVGDHRIAMSAAIAATIADGPVTITGAQCVEKSYPSFWDLYKQLGGCYEQYIR